MLTRVLQALQMFLNRYDSKTILKTISYEIKNISQPTYS